MRHYRREKISSLIQEELGKIIERDLEFDGAMVTITTVEISDDLAQAKVRFSIFPKEKEPETFQVLEEKRKHLQFKLVRKLNIKPMPTLKFEIDETH